MPKNVYIEKRREYISEIESTVYIYEHKKTGANVVYIQNNDNEKAFGIGFKTLPSDDTGVMHIIEHSVLRGSKKYPVRDIFTEISKSSLATFLNAMTSPDMTIYPLSSKNDKDFENLTDIYLSSVLNPLLDEEVFKEEAWTYELDSLDSELKRVGVVLNEMKGISYSPEEILDLNTRSNLYPDTCYRYNFAGNPDDISKLTYEQFIETYNKFYHPSNACIVFYGDMDIESKLEYLDSEYLSKYNRKNIDTTINIQSPFSEIRYSNDFYSVSSPDQLEGSDYISMSFSFGKMKEEECDAVMAIASLLVELDTSPIKEALIEEKVCKSVYLQKENNCNELYISIVGEGFRKGSEKEFKDTIISVLERTSNELLDEDYIDGFLNLLEFEQREFEYGAYPKGVVMVIEIINKLMHKRDPIRCFKFEEVISSLNKNLKGEALRDIVKRCFLDNKHIVLNTVSAKLNLLDEKIEKEKEELEKYKNSLSKKELENLVKDTLSLNKFKLKTNKEEINKIPMLTLDDIEKDIDKITTTEENVDGVRFIKCNEGVSGIAYAYMRFDARHIKREDLPFLELYCSIITAMGTKLKSYHKLENELNKLVGRLDFSLGGFSDDSNENINIYVKVSSSMTISNIRKALDLIEEIMKEASFEDLNKMKDLIEENILDIDYDINNDELSIILGMLSENCEPVLNYLKGTDGLEYKEFLEKLCSDIETNPKLIQEKFNDFKNIFNRKNLIVAINTSKSDSEFVEKELMQFIGRLPNNNYAPIDFKFKEHDKPGMIDVRSAVNTIVKGYKLDSRFKSIIPELKVACNVLSYEYLWKEIRLKGGAYGAGIMINHNNSLIVYSYRDPNIDKTLHIFKKMKDFLRYIDLNESELLAVIIGACNSTELEPSPRRRGEKAIVWHLEGFTNEKRQEERDKILDTTNEKLQLCSEAIDYIISKNSTFVAGNLSNISTSEFGKKMLKLN